MSIRRIGLTGGIGSGKSTVAGMFAELGVPVLDLDRVGREVTMPGSDGLRQLVGAFGKQILNSDGELNRAALAQHCFADAARTKELNAIVHPLIWQSEEAWLEQQRGSYAMIEASVLLESGGADRMDAVVVVLADLPIRRERVLNRGGRSRSDFDAIVSRQCDDEQRRAAADFVISNNGSLEELKQQVCDVHEQLLGRRYGGC